MMLMLSPEDFRQLSPACQQELLALLTRDTPSTSVSTPPIESLPPEWETDEYLAEEDTPFYYTESPSPTSALAAAPPSPVTPPRSTATDTGDGTKQVLDISVTTARDLIANISDKSLTVLTQFASGQAVNLESLIGPHAPYRDMNELKRSLVGAVNRRLRTVTDNRAAVLFASSRDRQRIHITGRSAASLRQAMQLPEPLPELGFINQQGKLLPANDPTIQPLQQQLQTLWARNTLRPLEPRHHLLPQQIAQFLQEQGCVLHYGKPITDDTHTTHFEWVNLPTPADCLELIDPQGNIRINTDEGLLRLRVFISHPHCADVLASWAPL
jgi:hypothetical protein